jgi:hypothetical protein
MGLNMFVSAKKYHASIALNARWAAEYEVLLGRYNALVDRINRKGGEAFLEQPVKNYQFDQDELRSLLIFCHPDKHDGNEKALEITKKINYVRDRSG